MATGYSPCFYTDVQPPIILNVPYDIPSKPSRSTLNPSPSPHYTSAQPATLPIVGLHTKPFSLDRTPKSPLILLQARSLLSKFNPVTRFAQYHFYDIILRTRFGWRDTPKNQTFLSGYRFFLRPLIDRLIDCSWLTLGVNPRFSPSVIQCWTFCPTICGHLSLWRALSCTFNVFTNRHHQTTLSSLS